MPADVACIVDPSRLEVSWIDIRLCVARQQPRFSRFPLSKTTELGRKHFVPSSASTRQTREASFAILAKLGEWLVTKTCTGPSASVLFSSASAEPSGSLSSSVARLDSCASSKEDVSASVPASFDSSTESCDGCFCPFFRALMFSRYCSKIPCNCG